MARSPLVLVAACDKKRALFLQDQLKKSAVEHGLSWELGPESGRCFFESSEELISKIEAFQPSEFSI